MLKGIPLSINIKLDPSYLGSKGKKWNHKQHYQLLAWNRPNECWYFCLQLIEILRGKSRYTAEFADFHK